jgi:hypothetical protein
MAQAKDLPTRRHRKLRIKGYSDERMSPKTLIKLSILATNLAVLIVLPTPLLPPQRLVEFAQSSLGLGGQAAFLLCAIAVQVAIYSVLGLSTTFAVKGTQTFRGRLLQTVALPLVVVSLALTIRSLRAGHAPVWINVAIPVAACMGGVVLGLSVLYRCWKVAGCIVTFVIGIAMWAILTGGSPQLRAATEENLRRIVAAGPSLPSGDARFGALLQSAFATSETIRADLSTIEQNRAAILAFGIAVGHSNIARFIGLKADSVLVENAFAVSQGTTLNGREDWPRHYAVSAALSVLEHPIVSDAGGLMKEQLDTLTRGSGFSFGDLAADRAGVRFAFAATRSEIAAHAMQARLRSGFSMKDFFPLEVQFPENLSMEEFRHNFGNVGSERYQSTVNEIEAALDHCSALSSN